MNLIFPGIIIALIAMSVYFIQRSYEPKLLPIVEGYFQPEFMAVANALRRNMENGREKGAALAVFYNNEVIIDMWAGYADPNSLTRWRNETTTLMFDCTKAIMAIWIAKLVDRGVLNYSEPISRYWPEFGQNGKEEITLEQLLSHQAGIPYLSDPISLRDLQTDSNKVEKLLVNQTPVWKPGTKFGYHSYTYGLYLDKLIQKLDPAKREVAAIFEEEITHKYDIEFSFNMKKEKIYQTARLRSISIVTRLVQLLTSATYLKLFISSMFETQSVLSKTTSCVQELAMPYTVLNNPELREIHLSSYSGTGTARGLAKLFSLLVTEPTACELLLSKNTFNMMTEKMAGDICTITGLSMSFGRGVQIFRNPYGDPVFGHAGEGGQIVIVDPKNKLSIAFLTNYLTIYRNGDDPRFLDIQTHIYNNLERYISRKHSYRG